MRRGGRGREECGFSLVELLVVLLLMGVVGTIVVKGVTTVMRQTRLATDRAVALSALQTATDRMSRELRAAEPLVTATGTGFTVDILRSGRKIRFTAQFNTASSPVTLTMNEKTFASALADPATATPLSNVTRILLTKAQAPATGTYFTYGYIDPVTGVPGTTSAPTAAQLAKVYLVTEAFGQRVGSRPVYTSTTVTLRNNIASTG